MIEEAIILVGGFGTRIKSILKGTPKPLAPVGGRPFLNYILDFLHKNRIRKVILSVGYKKEEFIERYGNLYKDIQILYSKEDTPLGTGGAIKASLKLAEKDNIFVLNGDTLFTIELRELYNFHINKNAIISVALKQLTGCQRYGSVQIDKRQRIVGFREKTTKGTCLINGGIYIIDKKLFRIAKTANTFSFEKDILEKYHKDLPFYGKVFDAYFIDIGIPEDYKRANQTILDIKPM